MITFRVAQGVTALSQGWNLRVDGGSGKIEAVRFDGDGCAISMASASMLTDRLAGMTLEQAKALTRDEVLERLGIPLSPARVKCALTGFVALGRALHPGALTPTGA